VTVGLEEAVCRRQNEAYFKFITTGLPFVTVKLGATLDGRLGPAEGHHEAVTGKEFQRLVHRLRRDHCAVMVGGRTVVADDPELTVRLARPVTHPTRVVVLGGELPRADSRVFTFGGGNSTVVFSAPMQSLGAEAVALREHLQASGGKWYEVPSVGPGKLDLGAVVRTLGTLGVSRLMVEGGGRLAGAMAEAGMVDRWVLAWAPCFVGPEGTPLVQLSSASHMDRACRVRLEKWSRMGQDLVGFYRSGLDYTQVIRSGEERS